MQLKVVCSDGSVHTYPKGFTDKMKPEYPDWIFVLDEFSTTVAAFYRPRCWLFF